MRIVLPAFLLLSACASSTQDAQNYLLSKNLTPPTIESFETCRAYGCKEKDTVTLSAQEWAPIDALFSQPSTTAHQERPRLAVAIGILEEIVGEKTGTRVDRAGTFKKTGSHQLDCVDESTNSSVYLSLLEQRGHMRFHKLEAPSTRLPIIHAGRWPHQTAVISDLKTSRFYAVDSWFHDNGAPAEIVSLKLWKEGWKPEEDKETTPHS